MSLECVPESAHDPSFNVDHDSFDNSSAGRDPGHHHLDSAAMSQGIQPHDLVDFKILSVFFVLGCTGLVPSTLLVTAIPFFQSRMLGSPFSATFSSHLFIAHNSSAFIFLAHATATSKSSSPKRQTCFTILGLLLLTFLLTIITLIQTMPDPFFIFIVLVAILYAACVSYFQSPVFAVAAIFGPRAVQAVMAGQAAVGVGVNLVQVVGSAISLFPSAQMSVQSGWTPEDFSAFICFTFTTCLLLVSLVAHGWLVRTPAYKILIPPTELCTEVARDESEERQMLLLSSDMTQTVDTMQETTKDRIIRVATVNVVYEIAVAYVCIVTLSVFPPITATIKPVNPWFHPLLFNAVHALVFCLGDLLGRHLCSFPSLLIWSSYQLLCISLAHTLFIPLFVGCNIQFSSAQPAFSSPGSGLPLINSDLLFFLILLGFGTSNGYVSTQCLMAAPSLQHNKKLKGQEDVDTAVTIGLFCMVAGLTVGSGASFAVRAVVCSCNPFTG